jgi:hypothetical protein
MRLGDYRPLGSGGTAMDVEGRSIRDVLRAVAVSCGTLNYRQYGEREVGAQADGEAVCLKGCGLT